MKEELRQRVEEVLAGTKKTSPEELLVLVRDLREAVEKAVKDAEMYRDWAMEEQTERIKAVKKLQTLKDLTEVFCSTK